MLRHGDLQLFLIALGVVFHGQICLFILLSCIYKPLILTLLTTFCLHMGHFCMCKAQSLQQTRWPQGRKTIDTVLSKHTLQRNRRLLLLFSTSSAINSGFKAVWSSLWSWLETLSDWPTGVPDFDWFNSKMTSRISWAETLCFP